MIEFLKNIKSKIGIYHLEDDAISIGKILKISGKYLFLDSYDSNNKKEGIKVFLISEIKRVILKKKKILYNFFYFLIFQYNRFLK